MAKFFISIICLGLILFSGCNTRSPEGTGNFAQRLQNITRTEMQGVLEFLADDLLLGRAPGARGGNLAEIYIKSLFKWLDLNPSQADGGKYLQTFTLKKFNTEGIQLLVNGTRLKFIEDIVGTYTRAEENFRVSGEAVFVGFGIKADLWNWNDFKDVDLTGKIIVTRVNDPGFYKPDVFEGKTLTYFGRWTCHVEEAIRRGAKGILLIHTDETAGYNWQVVKNSWTNGEFFIPSEIDNGLLFRGWIKEASFRKLLKHSKLSLDELNKRSLTRSFKPLELGFKINISGRNTFQDVKNSNVIAHIRGKSNKRIVLSAHIDHFGDTGKDAGDRIFNGAIDNGSAVTAMMLTAKILKEFQSSLHYSVTILACNSEEAGLLGSKYYVENTDRGSIIANINFESTPVWKKSRSLMGIGARFSTFEDIIKIIARKNGLAYSEFSLSNQGLFYRSDQFPFARVGIPAVWISAGEDEVDGTHHYTNFWKTSYHTVKDEYQADWDLGGMRQTIQAVLETIQYINKSRTPPVWKNNLTFPVTRK